MIIPSRAFVLVAVGPVLLSIGSLVDDALLRPTLLVDGIIVLVAALDALLARRSLIVVERRSPHVMSVGKPNTVTLELRSTARRRLSVEAQDDLFPDAVAEGLPASTTIPPRGRGVVKYKVIPGRRGAYELGDHFVRYASPLGLFIRQQRIPARAQVKVYPDIQTVRAYELAAMRDRDVAGVRTARRLGGESEFERLRDYRKGDEFRSIDWKATAKHSKIIAREYQLERNQNILFLLDAGRLMTAEVGGLSLFDHALNATLMLAHVASRAGDHVGLLAFSDSIKSFAAPAGGAKASARIVQAAYHLHPEITETSFSAAIDHVGARVKKRTLIVLFTQIVDDVASAELQRLLRGLMRRHLTLVVPFRDVEVEALVAGAAPDAAAWDDRGPYLRAAGAEIVSFQDKLLRDAKRRGALVLDCPPAELTPSLINKYLDIKARHLL